MTTGASPTTGLGRATLVVAALAVVAYAIAAILLVVPVENPPVQDCGAPGAYLLTGRLETFIDDRGRFRAPSGEVVQLSDEQAERARDGRCPSRVADRAVPAGVLWLAATVIGATALVVEVLVVRRRARRARVVPPGDWGTPQEDPGGTPEERA